MPDEILADRSAVWRDIEQIEHLCSSRVSVTPRVQKVDTESRTIDLVFQAEACQAWVDKTGANQ